MATPVRHHLLLCLGTGPLLKGQTPQEVARERSYRKGKYVRGDKRGRASYETPFVGEALLHLYPKTFTHVHLFGTADSMWDTLWLHLTEARAAEEDETRYLELHDAIQARTLETGHPWLEELCERFGKKHGVEAHVHVLPLPEGDAATWEMLRQMANLKDLAPGDALSLDITHGLRVQPLFLLLAARYLMALRPRLSLQHVFYGALDLHRGDDVPVYDLQAHVALLDWIEAARAFERYGDAAPVAGLLGDHRAVRFTHLARSMQLNALRDLREDARQVTAAFARVPEGAPVPFDLLLPALLELPRSLSNTEESWQAKMLLAQRHARGQNVGLAILAAWEAVLDRVALVYGLHDRTSREVAGAMSSIATGQHLDARSFYKSSLPYFETSTRIGTWATMKGRNKLQPILGQVTETLRLIRNALAHADEGLNASSFEPKDVYQLVDEGLFDYLYTALSHPDFYRLGRAVPDWKAAVRS